MLQLSAFLVWSLSITSIAIDSCPEPGKAWVCEGYVGSCWHQATDAKIEVCTDFTGYAWNRASAKVRCLVAAGRFELEPCPTQNLAGACYEELPFLASLAEVHRVYRPDSYTDFLQVCDHFHGNECVD